MDPKPQVQLLLTRRPIVCTRCMHGHCVDVITGREKTPTEYHCVFCGNYAIVGMPARWPFMEVVKAEKQPDIGIPASVPSDNTGSSPLQVGESLKPKKEEKSMAKPTCAVEGCKKPLAAVYLCEDHFKDEYGITVAEYKANKRHRTDSASAVAARLKGEKPEPKEKKQPAKPPAAPVTGIPATEQCQQVMQQEGVPLSLYLYPELLELLTEAAKAEWRTPEGQAAYLIEKAVRG